MGAGVNTAAMLIKYWKEYDCVIFSDTGDEFPETYEYIEKYLKPFCKEKELKWITVKHKSGDTLREYSIKNHTVPLRMTRTCTRLFKVYPIRKALRQLGATKKNPAIMDIGFAIDESHRLNLNPKHEVLYAKKNYPLLDDKITREGCEKIIRDQGWELPIKSGCYYCPFKSKKEMKKLRYTHPDLFDKAVEMEMNAYDYPKNPMFKTPLVTIKLSQNLDQWNDDEETTCDEGHCMT